MSDREFTAEDLDRAFDRAKYLSRPAAPRASGFSAEAFAEEIASRHGVSLSEVRGVSRLLHIATARRDVSLHFRRLGWSYPAIGKFLGNRDHSTIVTICKGKIR